MTRRQTALAVTSLILLNLAVRLIWLALMHPPQVDDFAWYFSHAKQMYEGQGYVWYGHYTSYWPIGYPFFLSVLFHLTGPYVTAGLLANILLSTGIVLLVYALTRLVARDPRVALAAATGYTILPSQIEWNSVLGSEELFTFLLMLSLCIFIAWKERPVVGVLVSGFVIGIAADVRPIVILFPIVLLVYLWATRREHFAQSVWLALLFAIAMFIGIAPVTIRNFIAIHHFVLVSTNGGVNLWQGTHTNGAYFWSWNRSVNPLLPYVKNDYVENQVATHAAIQYYLHHPLSGILNGFAKLFFLYWVDWNVVSVTFAERVPSVSSAVIRIAMWFNTAVYWLWMAVALTGLVELWRRGMSGIKSVTGWLLWPEVFIPFCYIVYNTAIFFLFPAWDRFRYPMMPLFAVYFGIGCRVISKKRTSAS